VHTDWAAQIRNGDARALARALSEVENSTPRGREILRTLFPFSGRTRKIGITGAPGAGKSSLVDRLAAEARRRDQTVGIIAVDPSSPYSGGAILGDRIRMQSHAGDRGIFIRSMATRGALGGLARAAGDAALVLDAAGRDLVFIETVGVGQDEVDVVKIADVVVVVLVPGMGDDVQALKAGILEIADVFVINKADREGADRLEQELHAMQTLAHRPDGWVPPVVRTVATEGRGVPELLDAVIACRFEGRAAANWQAQLREMLRDRLMDEVLTKRLQPGELEAAAREVAARERDPYSFVDEVLARRSKA
jgi:GTPase